MNLKPGFKRKSNWNKHQYKVKTLGPNQYLDYLIDPRFRKVNKIFVLSHQNIGSRTSYKRYFHPIVEIKDYNFMIDRTNVFDQFVENDLRTYDKFKKLQVVKGMMFVY